MSRLRAKCPDCKTYTAVALGPEYECHSCGRVYRSGLVRVPQAWGDGGEAMAEAAWLDLPQPETAIVEGETGHIVASGDAEAMAARIIQVLKDDENARMMGARGKAIVSEKFSSEHHLHNTLKLYDELLSKHAGRLASGLGRVPVAGQVPHLNEKS